MIKCKFKVFSIVKVSNCRMLEMVPVCGDENKPWSTFTPSGTFKITVTNPALFEQIDSLNPEDIFYIDLTKEGNL